MGENRLFKFQKLTPFEKAEMTGYEENLDYVFEKDNGDIKNVAISGPFGSGKSSVIRTYDKEHPDKKFIYISLAHFEGIPDEDDEYESVLEKKIINHLIQQVPECDVPDSGLRVKRTFDTKKGKSLAIRFVILIAFILYCSMWPDIHEMEDKVRLCDVLTGVIGTAIIGGVGLLNIFWLIIKALHAINNRRGIKSIQFKDVSMEFDDDQDKSYFDKHLDEILYLLQHAKCDAIIFEDIDRFDKADLKLLEHLRELCILGNSRIAVADEHTCRTLRFIYLIGDDVFKSNSDRTKFFDLIIPVIPVVDASNSYAKMREIFEKVGIFEQFDDHFLRGLCLYLDDFRTVKNIINEYQIYATKLKKTAKDPNKLLAIIAYKNVFPDDFSKLQYEDGYLYRVFQKKKSIADSISELKKKRLEELKDILKKSDQEKLINLEELEVVKRDRRSRPGVYNDYSYLQWQNTIYPQRRENIENKSKENNERIRKEISEIQKEISHISNKHLYQLITEQNEDEVFNAFKVSKEELLFYEAIGKRRIIHFLIGNGYIDETTYRDYIAYFYEKGISYSDKDFLISINSHRAKEFDYKISDPVLLLEYLNPNDFIQKETRNFMLVDYLLENNMTDYLEKFAYQIQENIDYDFVAKFFRHTENKGTFARMLNKYWNNAVVSLISSDNQDMSLPETQQYVIYTLAYCDISDLPSYDVEGKLTNYITNNFYNAECKEDDLNSVRAGLAVLKIKFKNLDEQIKYSDLRKAIYYSNLYELNQGNISSILANEYNLEREKTEGRELSAAFSDINQPLCKYINDHITDVMDDVVLKYDEICDDQETVTDIINGIVPEDEKEEYISKITIRYTDLSTLDENQWKKIIIYNKAEHNAEVILTYYNKFKLTSELIIFINSSVQNIDYQNIPEDLKAVVRDFWMDSIKCNTLDDDKYAEIVSAIGEEISAFNIHGLNGNKVAFLIEENIIDMNVSNLTFIRRNYKSLVQAFVDNNVSGYLDIAKGNMFIVEEAIDLLDDENIAVESRKELISRCSSVISLKDKKYDDSLVIDILSQKLDTNDLPYLFEHYDDYSEVVKTELYKLVTSNIHLVKKNIVKIAENEDLIEKIFTDTGVTINDKSVILDSLITSGISINIKTLLKNMGMNCLVKIVSGGKDKLPQIQNSVEHKIILNVFKKHKMIKDFSVDEESNMIKVTRK